LKVCILSELSSGNAITGTNAGPPPEGGSRAVSDDARGGGGGGVLTKVGGLVLKRVLTEWEKSYNNANVGNAEGAAGPPPEGSSRAVSDGAGGGGGGGGGGSVLGKVGELVLKRVLSEWDKSYNNANASAGNAEGTDAPASGSRGVSFALPIKPIKNVGLTGWRKFAAEWEKSQM
jgi:hypothetical protein